MKVENMLTFKLISIIDGFYHYEIYPEKNIEKKENQNEINTVYQIENIIDGQKSEVSQNTGVFDVAELNEKLEKENEIKFDEMYQKAFGTEVSEKRKERLKNEEKIDRKFYSKTSKK